MKRLLSATLALGLIASPMAAFAQQPPPPPQQGHGNGPGGPGGGHGPQGGPQGGGHQGGGHQAGGPQGGPGNHGPAPGHQPPPPAYGWHQGNRVPPGQRHVVQDWHHHRGLYAPPPGHEWVQYNNQYFLVAVTSGVIGAILGAAAASQ